MPQPGIRVGLAIGISLAKPTRERRSHYASLSLSLITQSSFFSHSSQQHFTFHHIFASQTHLPTSRQEVESHFLIPTELLGLGILLLLLLLLGVLLPEPPPPSDDSLGLPLAGSRGAESFGFGGTFGFG